jgi:rSAM/selenodomain-associated transferase 1
MNRVLIVVAKEPVPGQTKTRMMPLLQPEEAAELYRCLLLDTLALMRQVEGVRLAIAYTPAGARPYFGSLAEGAFELLPQRGHSLGERLDNVLRHYLDNGYEQAVVMDSDSPTLPPEYLEQAFAHLDREDVDLVLGPCEDGGYYLIGLRRPCSAVFDVVMSTPTVAQETLQLAHGQGLRTSCLPTWYDIDTPEELRRLQRQLPRLPAGAALMTRRFLKDWR